MVCDASSGESTIIYRLVSTAKRRIIELISFKISLIKIRNKSGPKIESWGTSAFMLPQVEDPLVRQPFVCDRLISFEAILTGSH